MSSGQRPASRFEVGGEFVHHREAVENSLLRGGLADVARVVVASVGVGAAAACIAALVALLY